jgi:hypothetical protein
LGLCITGSSDIHKSLQHVQESGRKVEACEIKTIFMKNVGTT